MGLALLTAASESTLAEVTAKFIDAESGKAIVQPEMHCVTHEEKSPQAIDSYTYVDYTESVEHIYSHKDLTYIVGYANGGVHADASMTRAEAATVFYRLYDKEYPDFERCMSNGTFPDVNTASWYYKEIATLYNIGLVEGKEKTSLRRTHRCLVRNLRTWRRVLQALNMRAVQCSAMCLEDVGHIVISMPQARRGWIQGYQDGTFRPDEPIRRVEVVTLVNGMINRRVTMDKLQALGVKKSI